MRSQKRQAATVRWRVRVAVCSRHLAVQKVKGDKGDAVSFALQGHECSPKAQTWAAWRGKSRCLASAAYKLCSGRMIFPRVHVLLPERLVEAVGEPAPHAQGSVIRCTQRLPSDKRYFQRVQRCTEVPIVQYPAIHTGGRTDVANSYQRFVAGAASEWARSGREADGREMITWPDGQIWAVNYGPAVGEKPRRRSRRWRWERWPFSGLVVFRDWVSDGSRRRWQAFEARKAEISNRTFGRLRQPWRKEQREMAASSLQAC